MGLCSMPNPSRLLAHLGTMVNAENGQILLLEHGRSRFAWLNSLLDKHAAAHADKHGCWWNKDIGKIVEDSGLEVVAMRRYHLGTTWWVELRPKKG
jgi:methyltransferase OMS1